MRKRARDVHAFRPPAIPEEPFTVVDCGARGGSEDAPYAGVLKDFRFIGFEPAEEECARLNAEAAPGTLFFPLAAGRRAETRTLYETREAACSSLLQPDREFFGRFVDGARSFEVVGKHPVEVVDLDTFLPARGITSVDFLKLDVQGFELDVLLGCTAFLARSVVAVLVEVEFSPMYVDQPLFSHVHTVLLDAGYSLFDLSRVRYRRANIPTHIDTRGQLLWGDALYLWDHTRGAPNSSRMIRLATLASAYGFHDYALEVIDNALPGLEGGPPHELMVAVKTYRDTLLRSGRLAQLFAAIERTPFRLGLRVVNHLVAHAHNVWRRLTAKQRYAWWD